MIALLIIEIIALSIRFDSAVLFQVATPFAWAISQTSLLFKFGITVITAILLFGGPQLTGLRSLAEHENQGRFPWAMLVTHFVALLAFYYFSVQVFAIDSPAAPPSVWLVSAWATIGLASVGSLAAMLLPVSSWRRVVRFMLKLGVVCFALTFFALVAGRLADYLWQPLASWTFSIVRVLLSAFYSPIFADADTMIVGTDAFRVEIAPECSGYEGIGLVAVFLAAFLWWFRNDLRFPQSLTLLPLGIILIWLANAVRIAGFVAVGSSLSSEVAVGGFHSQAGWIAFNIIVLGLVGLVWNSKFYSKTAVSRNGSRTASYPAAPYLLPFLVLIGTSMVTMALSSGGLDRLYPVRVVTVGLTLAYFATWYVRQQLLKWSWSWYPIAIGVAVFAIWTVLEPFSGVSAGASHEQFAELRVMPPISAGSWFFFRVLGSIVVVPLVEELAFRGFLTRRLISEDFEIVPLGRFTWFSYAASSVLFGLLHGRWIAGTIAGLLFGAAIYRRGRLMDAVLAHATANCLITCYVLTTGDLAAWS